MYFGTDKKRLSRVNNSWPSSEAKWKVANARLICISIIPFYYNYFFFWPSRSFLAATSTVESAPYFVCVCVLPKKKCVISSRFKNESERSYMQIIQANNSRSPAPGI